jgi:hypothetical protein
VKLVFAALALLPQLAVASDQEIQRALIQRDQQSAEFAAQIRGQDVRPLQALHARQLQDAGRPLNPDPEVARQLRPYERERMAAESAYVLRFSPPVERKRSGSDPDLVPLPLPGGPRHGVEPIAAPSVGG